MRGKIVNIFMGLLNITIGILIVFYTLYIPTDITELTVQETEVISILKIVIYIILGCTLGLNFLGYCKNKDNAGLKSGYRYFLFMFFFFIIKLPYIAGFALISGIIIINRILKENLREIESTLAISVIALLIVSCSLAGGVTYFYKSIGGYILDKKNKNQTEYSDVYFKYITELEDNEILVNVKKDGKYGYINLKGEPVIDYKYDFASPFTTINVYDKEFQIALVCLDGISKIIMKNERVVKSYVSESSDSNYDAKIEELKDFYKNTIKMDDEMVFEIDADVSNINKIDVYEEKNKDYTYRYDYNDEYDILVTKSSMGLKDTYALAKKDDINYRIDLDCDNLAYDENYLYLYKDGSIPFYSIDKNEQGWFSSRGRKVSMKGNAQILEKIDDRIVYKDYSQNGQINFVNQNGEKLSDYYKDIFVQGDKYVVKTKNDKYTIIDLNFNPIMESEYDIVDTTLASEGLYLFGNVKDNNIIKFNDFGYADMNFALLDSDGNVLEENIEQAYSKYYKMNSDNKLYVSRYNDFVSELESYRVKHVGDEFYKK